MICNISFSFTEDIDIADIKKELYDILLSSDISIEPDTLYVEFTEG